MNQFSPEQQSNFLKIAQEINAMAKVDQDMREKQIEDEKLAQPDSWDDSVDRDNTVRMKEIVARVGWPTISKVGKEASSNAWLLVQHADHDVEFQKHCLSLMKTEVKDVDSHDIAYLEDRIRSHTGQPQLYGTQFSFVDGKFLPLEIEDPEHIEERRKAMGLTTMTENIARMYRNYKIEKP